MPHGYCKRKDPDIWRYQDPDSEPAGIQTPNLLIRSQMLYSVKLQVPKSLAIGICSFKNWTANLKIKITQQNKTIFDVPTKKLFLTLLKD